MPLLASKGSSLKAKVRSYSALVHSVKQYGSETWRVNEKDVIKLKRDDARRIRWRWNVGLDDKISRDEHGTRLKLIVRGGVFTR